MSSNPIGGVGNPPPVGGPGIPGRPVPQPIPSEVAENLVMTFEGLRLQTYHDPSGYATIGYGHRLTHLESYPDGITKQQAYDLLMQDLSFAAKCVNSLVKVDLTQGQFDALCDFTYNLGAHALQGSTLLELLNKGEYQQAALQFGRWVYSSVNGSEIVLAGLRARRQAEESVWQTGEFSVAAVTQRG